MAETTFQPGTEWWRIVCLVVMGAICLVSAGSSLGEGDAGAKVLLLPIGILLIAGAIYHGLFSPFAVTLADQAAILHARARKIVIPWGDLYSVELTSNRFSSNLRWAFGRGKIAHIPADFGGLTSLLMEIRRHSPGTALP